MVEKIHKPSKNYCKKKGGGIVNVKEAFITMGHRLNWGPLQKEKGKYPEPLLGRNMTCNPTVPLKAMNTDCHFNL